MLRKGALVLLTVGALSACGHTPQERLASGVLIGGAIGAAVSLASEPGFDDYDNGRRYAGHHRQHRNDNRRRHRDWDDYEYDDYDDDYGCNYRC